ncbi:hypothetical protein ABH985_005255 [Bradyrhizobium ottawaense]
MTISPETSFGAGPARDQRRGDHDVLLLDVLGGERGLLGLVFPRHLLGVAAGGLRVLELLVLDGEEFRAERFDLLFGRGPHVGRGHDGAETARGRDRLEAGDADAHHEHFRRRHGAGSGHHHREGAAERLGALDHGAVTGEVRLRGQHVHHLRARDARHQFHREGGNAGIGDRLQRGLVAIGVHDGDDERAALVLRELGGFRTLHLDDDVGILQRICADGGTYRGEFGIRQARFEAGARLDGDLGAQRLELLHRIGRSGDSRLERIDFLGNGDLHRSSGGAGQRARKLSVTPAAFDTGFGTGLDANILGSCCRWRVQLPTDQVRKTAIRITMSATETVPYFTSLMKPS